MKSLSILLVLLAMLAGCDTYDQDGFAPEPVVEAYLIAGEPLPPIMLSTTAPIEATYRFEEHAIDGARMTVRMLDAAGAVADVFAYEAVRPGTYAARDTSHRVQPGRRYAFEAVLPGEATVLQAETLVPGAFGLRPLARDTIVYQSDTTYSLAVSESTYPGRSAIYLLKLVALDTTYALTPAYQGLFDNGDVSREELLENSSGITNEANFERIDDQWRRVIVPWIAIAHYGPNTAVVDAIDDNLFDFLRTREDNGLRAQGERENTRDRVTGGRGIFGSLVRQRHDLYILPPDDPHSP